MLLFILVLANNFQKIARGLYNIKPVAFYANYI